MQENNNTKIERDLQQIVDMLLLNGTLTESPGLVHGKMGISIFFFHYAQFSSNDLFADYAMDVISEMLDQIHVNSSADYENGIAGIGIGIDYLIQNNFLNVETDIYEDFDDRMLRAVINDSYLNFSQYSGLIGCGRYWMIRLYNQVSLMLARKCLLHIIDQIEMNLTSITETEQTDVFCFLHDLQKISDFGRTVEILKQCQKKWNLHSINSIQRLPHLGDSLVSDVVSIYQRNRYFNNALLNEVDIILKKIPDLDIKKAPAGTGLLYGYAGEGLLRLTALDQTNMSWMNLL